MSERGSKARVKPGVWKYRALDGRVSYQAKYRTAEGKQRTKTFPTQRKAETFLAQVKADKSRGQFHDPQRGRVLFAEVAEEWVGTLIAVSPKTRSGYEQVLRRVLLPAFGRRPVGSITTQEVQQFVSAGVGARGTPVEPRTAKKHYSVLRMVLGHATRTGRINSDPTEGVSLPRVAKAEMRFLDRQQVDDLAAAVGQPYDTLIRFAALTGLRAGELGALRWGRLDLSTGRVMVAETLIDVEGRLTFGPPKTKGSRRSFVMPGLLIEGMEKYRAAYSEQFGQEPDDQALVFPGPRGGPRRHGNFYRRHFQPAVATCAAADPSFPADLRFHDLRHTCATLMIGVGAHPKDIADHLGHSTIMLTMDTYGHSFPDRSAALAQQFDAYLRA